MALCHAVTSGEKTSVADRESGVALCHGVPAPRSLTCAIFFRPVFDSRSSFFAPKPHGNACYAGYRGLRDKCRSMPQGGVKKKGSVADRESGVAVPLGGVKKKKRSVADRESGVSPSLDSV